MNDAAPTWLLLHGAGTGGWVWDRVAALLPGRVLAPDLPGLARDVTPASAAAEVVDGLDPDRDGDVVVVLHSLAGMLGNDLARLLGRRMRRIVYVGAIVPQPGQSFARGRGALMPILFRVLLAFGGGTLRPTAGMIRSEYGNDLTEADIEMLIARIGPDRPKMLLTPIDAPLPDGPTTYVRLTEDRSVKLTEQDACIARLRGARVIDVTAGHMAPLSCPQEVAAAIAA